MNTIISLAATAAVAVSAFAVPALMPDTEARVGTQVRAEAAVDQNVVGDGLNVPCPGLGASLDASVDTAVR